MLEGSNTLKSTYRKIGAFFVCIRNGSPPPVPKRYVRAGPTVLNASFGRAGPKQWVNFGKHGFVTPSINGINCELSVRMEV